MIDVREVLRRWQAGQSARQISREGVAGRSTARRYIAAAKACELDSRSELSEEAVRAVMGRVQTRAALTPSEAWKKLGEERARIKAWLEAETPLTLVRVHELLARDGVDVGYTTLRRFAQRELGIGQRKPTVRLDDPPPGEETQADFGLAGYVMGADGKRRKLWMLIVTFTVSRYMFVWPTFLQTTEALCEGLDAAWRFFGGVSKRVVFDNPTTIIVRASATDPTVNPSFSEYAQARGFFVDAARVRHPKDKARVENQVPFVRERWFAGETFSDDLVELRRSAEVWCRDVAGARIHGTTRCVPRIAFETEELSTLLPAPLAPFDVPRWTEAKVHPDHHVQVARALYSVPTRYVGRRLRVRADRSTVRLYAGGELVKMHGRVAPGKRATDPSDYPSGKAEYALRSVDGLVRRARERGEHVGEYTERLLAGPLPWTRMRQAYGLLRLCDRYGAERVDGHCARALSFDVIDVPRIERMLRSAQRTEEAGEATGKLVRLPTGRFARDTASFATRPTTTTAEGGE